MKEKIRRIKKSGNYIKRNLQSLRMKRTVDLIRKSFMTTVSVEW